MAGERNRIIELTEYLSSIGIDVNIGTTKARGHSGIFMHGNGKFRIDISKKLDSNSILSVLLHEYAHFIHFSYDPNLKSLDFLFEETSDEILEELIRITVDDVPKDFASSLYSKKQALSTEVKVINSNIKKSYPDFILSKPYKTLEKNLPNPFKYLLKYDRIKYFNKIYSIKDAENNTSITTEQLYYIKLKSLQRGLKRINSRINRLNKYYNNPSELFARFVAMYYTNPEKTKRIAPLSYQKLKNAKLPQLEKIDKIFSSAFEF